MVALSDAVDCKSGMAEPGQSLISNFACSITTYCETDGSRPRCPPQRLCKLRHCLADSCRWLRRVYSHCWLPPTRLQTETGLKSHACVCDLSAGAPSP